MIRRRDFMTLLGSAAAWPVVVHAQQVEGMRRIGVLVAYEENEPVAKARVLMSRRARHRLGLNLAPRSGSCGRADHRRPWLETELAGVGGFELRYVSLKNPL
jgi:hypothetical protein